MGAGLSVSVAGFAGGPPVWLHETRQVRIWPISRSCASMMSRKVVNLGPSGFFQGHPRSIDCALVVRDHGVNGTRDLSSEMRMVRHLLASGAKASLASALADRATVAASWNAGDVNTNSGHESAHPAKSTAHGAASAPDRAT
jgi:hypothetical protein